MIVPCQECQANISDRAGWCPHCGMPPEHPTPINATVHVRTLPEQEHDHTLRKLFAFIMGIGLLGFIAFGLLVGVVPGDQLWSAILGLLLIAILVSLP